MHESQTKNHDDGAFGEDGVGEIVRLLLSFLLALLIAYFYNQESVDTENFALGSENTYSSETYSNLPFTASNVQGIKAIADRAPSCNQGVVRRVMWLGNSQLHTINNYRFNQHLSPYWLRKFSKTPDCFEPVGFSLPNANFQEYLAVSGYVADKNRLDAVIFSLVFDDLREDGLRPDFSELMTESLREKLMATGVGREIFENFKKESLASRNAQGENQGLEGFIQKNFEDHLTDLLAKVAPIWGDRPNLRARLVTDLYYFRNFVLNIQPTTVRKKIPARYARNMASLEAALTILSDKRVPVVMYVAPIRQDVTLPYEPSEYSAWKSEVSILAARYRVHFLNLETLVPVDLWGTYHKSDVDFMHFQGDGHRLLADAIASALQEVIGEF